MNEWTPITDDEAATLNAARDVFKQIQDRASALNISLEPIDHWKQGRLQVVCEVADWHTFQVLNYANVYLDTPLDDDVLHNRKTEV